MADHLTIDVDSSQADDGIVRVRLEGELDPASAPRLQREMQALLFTAAPRELVLDFQGVTFMDSSGIRTVIELSNQLRDREGVLVLEKVPETPRRVLEVTGLTEHLDLR